MIVLEDGRTEGTVGGGIVEAAAVRESARVFEERRAAFVKASESDGAGSGMACGGNMELLCEYVEASEEAIRIFDQVREDEGLGRESVLCTELTVSETGLETRGRFLFPLREGGPGPGEVPCGLLEAVGKLTGSAMADADGRLFCLDTVGGGGSLFIFGAGHVARETAALATHVDFRVFVMDDRDGLARAEHFTSAAGIKLIPSFEGCFEGLPVDRNSSVVIMTRGHAIDRTVLEQALRTDAGYIGMIGSSRKRDTVFRSLLSQGFTDRDLERVHCPIGISIQSETPAEIAVSIVAELIRARALLR
jgi:xanthine dehydrogenase accessory factor